MIIDIHSHIIPDVDDGPDSISETIQILKEARKQGIDQMIATPHYIDEYKLTPAETRAKIKEVQQAVDKEGINIKILPGAEVYITSQVDEKIKDGEIMTLNDSRYVLMELPFDVLPQYVSHVLYNLKVMGYIPVICHPERYKYIIKKPEYLRHWIEEGIMAQVNAGSLIGVYGSRIKKAAREFIYNRYYQFIGSDVHSNGKRRIRFKEALEIIRKMDKNYAIKLLDNNRKLVKDEDIKIEKPAEINRSIFDKLKVLLG